jgi:hypothetical protein
MCCSDDPLPLSFEPLSEELDATIPNEDVMDWSSPERLVPLNTNIVALTYSDNSDLQHQSVVAPAGTI